MTTNILNRRDLFTPIPPSPHKDFASMLKFAILKKAQLNKRRDKHKNAHPHIAYYSAFTDGKSSVIFGSTFTKLCR